MQDNSVCPSSCENEIFTPEISAAQLFVQNVGGIVTDVSEMQSRYKNALEVRSRVSETEMKGLLNYFAKLSATLQLMGGFINLQVVNPRTSVSSRVYAAANRLTDHVRTDVNTIRSAMINMLEVPYNLYISHIVTEQTNKISRLQSYVQMLQTFREGWSSSYNQELSDTVVAELKKFASEYEANDSFLKILLTSNNITRLSKNKACSTILTNTTSAVQSLIASLEVIKDVESAADQKPPVIMPTLQYLEQLSICQTDYGNLLNDIKNWFKSVDLPSKYSSSDSQYDAISEINTFLNDINYEVSAYATNTTTKFLLSEYFQLELSDLKNALISVQDETIDPVSNDFTANAKILNTTISRIIIDFMHHLGELEFYIKPPYFDFKSYGRSLRIWQKPFPVFTSGQVSYRF